MSRRTRLHVEALEDRCLLSFSPVVSYPVGATPQAVVAADFNNDTVLDLAVANYDDSTVSVLLGNGDGAFQDAVNYPTGHGALSLAVGDLDGDGNLDLATANASGVSVLFGDGQGAFGAPTSINLGSDTASVAVGDFNADGNLDLGVTSNVYVPGYGGYYSYGYGYYANSGYYEGRAHVLLGNGAGAFSDPYTTSLGYGWHTSAAVADFNRDGNDDFATGNSDYGTVSVLLGASVGDPLGAPTSFATGWYPQAVTVGDFTGDGILDLATAGQTIDILPGYGDGTFRPVVRQYIDPVALAAADFNGDGKLDLVTADYGISVFLGTGDGALRPPIVVATEGLWAVGVAVGDFNGDGRPDVASADAGSNSVSVLLNDGTWLAADAPSITIGDVTVTEGNTGTTDITFTVSLSVAYSQTVTVHYATADGSATVASGDYQEKSGTLIFGAGETSKTVTVLVNGDRLVESTESFTLRLSDPTNAFVTDATALGAIMDDEPRISITPSVSRSEGNTGQTPFAFTVTLSSAYDVAVTVDWATKDVSATAGSDYQASSGTLTFAPGETSKTINVLVNGDRLPEPTEAFMINLSAPTNGTITAGQGIGFIVDDEPRITIGDVTVKEGNTGTGDATFTVRLSAAYDVDVTVRCETANGSAIAGSDYVATSAEVTIPAGQTSATFTVAILADRTPEPNKTFTAILSAPTNAQIVDGQGSGTILDDEPRISIDNVSRKEGGTGKTTVFTFTVSLSAAYDQVVTVNYATAAGTATAGTDYDSKSGTVTFAPGETSKTITVVVKGDKLKEANESFFVNLSGASSNALLLDALGIGTILDDDNHP